MEANPMRPNYLIFGGFAVALLAGCSNQPRAINATPPTVSYEIRGNDLSQTNASASTYCAQYGMAPQLQSQNGRVAQYTCVGGSASSRAYPNNTYAAPMAYGAPTTVAPAVQCADALHQGRPGGTDYYGPPVPGCPQQ
jgi:hypothetical protein